MSADKPRYEIVEYIGKGGMGAVFRGVSHGVDGFRRDVAVKRLRSSKALDYDARRKFLQEARLSAALDHPNIVPVFDYAKDDQGRVCLIMAFVDGINLRDLMDETLLPVPVTVHIIRSVLQGLAHAHRHGVIHRDIKPGNVMISRAGAVQITDFGLAHDTRSPGEPGEGGTPGFMSPEALQDMTQNARSDLFSVGVILYELLTGQRAFPGENARERIAKTLGYRPPPPIEIRSEVSEMLSDATIRLLALEPADRFGSALEVLDCLPQSRHGSEDLAMLIEQHALAPQPNAELSSEDELTTARFRPKLNSAIWGQANDGNTVIIPDPVPVPISQDPAVIPAALDFEDTGAQVPVSMSDAPAQARPAIVLISAPNRADDGCPGASTEEPGHTAEPSDDVPSPERSNEPSRTAKGSEVVPSPGPASKPAERRTRRRLYIALAAIAALVLCAVLGQHALRHGELTDSVPHATAPSTAPEPAIQEPPGDDIAPEPEPTSAENRALADVEPESQPSTMREGAESEAETTATAEDTTAEHTTAEPVAEKPARVRSSITATRAGSTGRRERARARKQPRENQEEIAAPTRWRQIPIGTDNPWEVPIQRGENP